MRGAADDRGEGVDRIGIEVTLLAKGVQNAVWSRRGGFPVGDGADFYHVIQRGQTLVAEVGGEKLGLIRLLAADAKANLLKRLRVAG